VGLIIWGPIHCVVVSVSWSSKINVVVPCDRREQQHLINFNVARTLKSELCLDGALLFLDELYQGREKKSLI
jgi:hypothetical protein